MSEGGAFDYTIFANPFASFSNSSAVVQPGDERLELLELPLPFPSLPFPLCTHRDSFQH